MRLFLRSAEIHYKRLLTHIWVNPKKSVQFNVGQLKNGWTWLHFAIIKADKKESRSLILRALFRQSFKFETIFFIVDLLTLHRQ